jgi:DNA-binding GntR family transcriptional regulator
MHCNTSEDARLRCVMPGYVDHVTVDHDSPVPVYQQLANLLRRRILDGELMPGRALPSEAYLAQEHGISPLTVRKAVRVLKAEGYVYTVTARGSYVTDPAEWPRDGS